MKQRYYSYKPSGIDWIGDIPSHWNIVRLAHIFNAKAGGDAKPELYSDTKDAIHPFPVFTNSLLENQVYAYTSSPTFQSGSITVTGRGEIGHAFLRDTDFDAIIRLLVLTPRIALCCKYFTYFIDGVMEFFSDSAAVSQLSAQQINKEQVIIPPLAEQEAIAAWLDEKCGEIDAAIAKVDREIELIDELKQSEISRVVTRGLNPDALLRPSGIDWIGDIPSHWKINKLKYHAEIFSGEALSTKNLTEYSEIPVYGGGNILGYSKVANTKCNTLITGRVGGDGTVRLIRKNFWATDNALIIETDLEKTFLCNILNCANLIRLNTSTAQPLLTATKIKNVEIPVPPLPEQQAIVDYLDKKCAEMDGLKAKLTKKRETLKELRQSIISEVVTGKRKII